MLIFLPPIASLAILAWAVFAPVKSGRSEYYGSGDVTAAVLGRCMVAVAILVPAWLLFLVLVPIT